MQNRLRILTGQHALAESNAFSSEIYRNASITVPRLTRRKRI